MSDQHFHKDSSGRSIIEAYVDGACSGNPGPGGFGVVILDKHRKPHFLSQSGGTSTTNNRMELSAAIALLKWFSGHGPCSFTIHADSQYVIKGMTEWLPNWQRNGWRNAQKKPVENQDLWQELATLAAQHQIKWVWVQGHSGHEFNEMADRLAVKARHGTTSSPDFDGDNSWLDAPDPATSSHPISTDEALAQRLVKASAAVSGMPSPDPRTIEELRAAALAAAEQLTSRRP